MKRILVILLSATVLVIACACSAPANEAASEPSQNETPVPTATAAPTPEPTPTQEPYHIQPPDLFDGEHNPFASVVWPDGFIATGYSIVENQIDVDKYSSRFIMHLESTNGVVDTIEFCADLTGDTKNFVDNVKHIEDDKQDDAYSHVAEFNGRVAALEQRAKVTVSRNSDDFDLLDVTASIEIDDSVVFDEFLARNFDENFIEDWGDADSLFSAYAPVTNKFTYNLKPDPEFKYYALTAERTYKTSIYTSDYIGFFASEKFAQQMGRNASKPPSISNGGTIVNVDYDDGSLGIIVQNDSIHVILKRESADRNLCRYAW